MSIYATDAAPCFLLYLTCNAAAAARNGFGGDGGGVALGHKIEIVSLSPGPETRTMVCYYTLKNIRPVTDNKMICLVYEHRTSAMKSSLAIIIITLTNLAAVRAAENNNM